MKFLDFQESSLGAAGDLWWPDVQRAMRAMDLGCTTRKIEELQKVAPFGAVPLMKSCLVQKASSVYLGLLEMKFKTHTGAHTLQDRRLSMMRSLHYLDVCKGDQDKYLSKAGS